MPNKWFLRIGSFLFAFALLVGCANDDNNPDNDEQPGDVPMEEEGNNLEEDLEEEGNNMEDNMDDMEDNMDMDGEGNNQEEDSDMLEHENEHGVTE